MYILPYKAGSQSAKDLGAALGCKLIKRINSRFKGSPDKLVINWGSSNMDENIVGSTILNEPEAVLIASNKKKFFELIINHNQDNLPISIPEVAFTKKQAEDMLNRNGKIVARTVLNGHSGNGIVMIDNQELLDRTPAELYTCYIPKKSEYRVHVFLGKVVDVQRKARDKQVPDDKVDWQIRNHDNGFIYVRDEGDIYIPDLVKLQCINVVKVCGLHFGAVDVVYNERHGLWCILEVNTAPGLCGQTLNGYAERFKKLGEVKEEARIGWDKAIKQIMEIV